ncbi:MAG: hypothetical protein ACHQ01_10795, partial [Candidatus Limnocylindrales bacterium]
MPRVIGPAPLTVRSREFVAGLAVSNGLTPTLRPLEHQPGAGGPAGLIGGLAVPVAPSSTGSHGSRPGARSRSAAGGEGEAAAGATSTTGAGATDGAAGPRPGLELQGAPGAATEPGPVRRLPLVDPAAAEQRRPLTSVDPASDFGRSPDVGAGTGRPPGPANLEVAHVEATGQPLAADMARSTSAPAPADID